MIILDDRGLHVTMPSLTNSTNRNMNYRSCVLCVFDEIFVYRVDELKMERRKHVNEREIRKTL